MGFVLQLRQPVQTRRLQLYPCQSPGSFSLVHHRVVEHTVHLFRLPSCTYRHCMVIFCGSWCSILIHMVLCVEYAHPKHKRSYLLIIKQKKKTFSPSFRKQDHIVSNCTSFVKKVFFIPSQVHPTLRRGNFAPSQ